MTDGSIGIQTNRAFYKWLKKKLPGWWPPEDSMIVKDLKSLYPTEWLEWTQSGRPATYTATDIGGVTPEDTIEPTIEPTTQDFIWFVPNIVLQDRTTGKFYDANGQAEIPQAMAMQMLNDYNWKNQPETDWARQSAIQSQQLQAYLNQQPRSNLTQVLEGRKQMAGDYETWRERLLAELTSPSDWITRWQVVNQPNPYSVSAQEEQNAIIEERANQLQWEIGSLQSGQPNPLIGGTIEQKQAELQQLETEQAGAARYGAQLSLQQPPQPTTPPAPGWLPQFVPGQVAGQPITKQRVTTPSGQQFARTPWSQREGLAGYAEWAGYRPYQDILEQMAMMQPYTPNIAQAWRPASQRR